MNCSKELERRKGLSSEEKIGEEFVGRLKNLLHQVTDGGLMRTHWRLRYSEEVAE